MGIAAGTEGLYFFEGDGSDSSGNGRPLVANGTPLFATTPTPIPQGAQVTGPTDDTNWFEANAALKTAMQGSTGWTAEGYGQFSDISAEPAFVEFFNNASINIWMQVLLNGAIRVGKNGASTFDSSAGIITAGNTWYNWALTGTASQMKVYLNNANVITAVTDGTLPATINDLNIGKLDLAAGRIGGKFDAVRFSSIVQPGPFPTVDGLSPALLDYRRGRR